MAQLRGCLLIVAREEKEEEARWSYGLTRLDTDPDVPAIKDFFFLSVEAKTYAGAVKMAAKRLGTEPILGCYRYLGTPARKVKEPVTSPDGMPLPWVDFQRPELLRVGLTLPNPLMLFCAMELAVDHARAKLGLAPRENKLCPRR